VVFEKMPGASRFGIFLSGIGLFLFKRANFWTVFITEFPVRIPADSRNNNFVLLSFSL